VDLCSFSLRRLHEMKGLLSRIQNWEVLARNAKFKPAIMAAFCCVSLRQLERFFNSHFKMTPTEWARDLRCKIARQLIGQGWSNKAVVFELGYANDSHLCHEFQKVYGTSPRSFAPVYLGTVVFRQ